MDSDHIDFVNKIILKHFGVPPTKAIRMTTGIANEVYSASLPDKEVIVRIARIERFLLGSQKHIPIFKSLGIKVPDILAEDYAKTLIPFAYQIQSKIEGQDIGEVISTLSEDQLKDIAKEICNIFKKVRAIPSDGKFGYLFGYKDLFNTWTERMVDMVKEAEKRGKQTGVMDESLELLLEKLLNENRVYFDNIKSETYFDDMSGKNVMINDGVFTGLVDLDNLAEGDFLDTVGRIKASFYGTSYGKIYTDFVMDELKLNLQDQKMVTVYALMNLISWTCENGIQFNQNTKAEVDWKKDTQNKEKISLLEKDWKNEI